MSPFLVAVAAVATAGAVVALAARDGRIATLGLTVALVAAPLVSDPFPEPAVLAVRVFGALLVAYVLWVGLRGTGPTTRGSAVGWLALGLAATAAFVAGLASHSLFTTIETPAAALAAGIACMVVALVPVIRAREAFRLTLGLVLLLLGVTLLRVGLAGAPGALESVAAATALALLAAAGMTVAGLVHADAGDFALRTPEPEPVRRRPTDEAHRRGGGEGPRQVTDEAHRQVTDEARRLRAADRREADRREATVGSAAGPAASPEPGERPAGPGHDMAPDRTPDP